MSGTGDGAGNPGPHARIGDGFGIAISRKGPSVTKNLDGWERKLI